VKINIHSDQYIQPTTNRLALTGKPAAAQGSTPSDELAAITPGSSVTSTLNRVDSTRAARVSQLAALYSSGRYVVSSAKIAQALVSGALSRVS
jgi:hypothetical protein